MMEIRAGSRLRIRQAIQYFGDAGHGEWARHIRRCVENITRLG
jgi:hypothetical protein